VIKGTIIFSDIKPHGGDQRRAFEEMCFQLFANEFAAHGEPIRREGSGGDAGMEGYISDSGGFPVMGLQVKFFPEKFGTDQWRKIDESVRAALNDTTADCSLKRFVVATPRAFNKTENEKWKRYQNGWQQYAKQIGYHSTVRFVHWGSSFLESLLKENKNRGQLLYWFNYPNFDRKRCVQLTRATIAQLGDRYIPGLHTPTECEGQIHIFLRTERTRKTYLNETREAIRHERFGGLATEKEWPDDCKRLMADCRKMWQKFRQEFGDGVSFPASFAQLASKGSVYHERHCKLVERLWAEVEKLPPQPLDQMGERTRSPLEKDVNSLDRNSGEFETYVQRLQNDFSLADTPFLLVSGEAGSGKNHTLAEICSRYLGSGGIALFSDGGQFPANEQPWNQFLKWADFTDGGIRDFLACLSALAATTPLPGLICIDALNETLHREVWLSGLEKFAAELQTFPNLKLLVSCRTDYLDLTVPENVRQQKLELWRHIQHEGLGLNVFEAVPKYLRAYRVKGGDITPLTPEFSRPLMLKTFCEAFEDDEPPPGSLSLPRILEAYVNRKSKNIASRIGCAPSAVLDALPDIAASMLSAGSLQLPERDVRNRLLSHYPQAEEGKSLYRALVAEGILAEFPHADNLGTTNVVRFTFERIWDYFLSLHLMPTRIAPSDTLKARLDDWRWRLEHRGVVEVFAIRLPEEGHGEIVDIARPGELGGSDLGQAFIRSIPWRTTTSCSKRTAHWFNHLCARSSWTEALECLFPVLVNPEHPWNSDWLHFKLQGMSLEEREREWTIWLNEQFRWADVHKQPIRIIRLAETCDRGLLSSRQLMLLATALGWMLTTTAVSQRNRISLALARLLRNDTVLSSELVERFIATNDPYVVERVLFAAASSAIHAQHGDEALASLARLVHSAFFSKEHVPPNVIIRHYASVICEQASEKGVLDAAIKPKSFRPRFRSVWPSIWSEAEEAALEKSFNSDWDKKRPLGAVISSTRTEQMGGYGDWGRYEMGARVRDFQDRRLAEEPNRKWSYSGFDDRVARRYVLQRAVELGITKQDFRDVDAPYDGRNRPSIERLGKKYQWIAMHEFLGYLSDHYHMTPDWEDEPPLFESARQLSLPDLLDPFAWKPDEVETRAEWEFIQKPAPWWARYPNPFPRVLTTARREKLVVSPSIPEPSLLLRTSHESCEWTTLSGYFRWEEPVPAYVSDKWSTAHVLHSWLFNSYAVPESALSQFTARMIEPVLNGNMRPPEPDFRSEVLTLLKYPSGTGDLERYCGHTFAQTSGAWFTTCDYSDEQDGSRSLHGYIPSPPLAKMLKIKWTKSGLDFSCSGSSCRVVFDAREEDFQACLCQVEPLLSALSKRKLKLVWRVFGWKWIGGTMNHHSSQREYWALYSLDRLGRPYCLGGGTWIVKPNATREPLPWPVSKSLPSEQKAKAL
jgi:hypothetical protein